MKRTIPLTAAVTAYNNLVSIGALAMTSTDDAPAYAAALERLFPIARSDTGQGAKVANFILAWWNAGTHGGFDLSDLFSVDASIAADMAEIVAWMAAHQGMCVYPDEYRADIEAVLEQWRPEVMKRARGA